MKRILLAISLFFLSSINGIAQEYKVKGRIVLGQNQEPIGEVYVGFDTVHMVQTSQDGKFEVSANEQLINDTLTVYFISHNKISITNFPKNSVIDLGTIPIYEYDYGVPTVYFDCEALDFACKKKERKFWKEYDQGRKAYFKKVDTIIGLYRMSLNGRLYAIDPAKHLIDLNKPIQK